MTEWKLQWVYSFNHDVVIVIFILVKTNKVDNSPSNMYKLINAFSGDTAVSAQIEI